MSLCMLYSKSVVTRLRHRETFARPTNQKVHHSPRNTWSITEFAQREVIPVAFVGQAAMEFLLCAQLREVRTNRHRLVLTAVAVSSAGLSVARSCSMGVVA